MNHEVICQTESDEEIILTVDVPDNTLERAAGAEPAYTFMYCTNAWYNCTWPQ
jgi:hypothetical protein